VNDLQEAILDHLMTVDRIGAGWDNGPLGLARRALLTGGLTTATDAAAALGYPAIFCEALQWAVQVLQAVDDRRALAITVFTEVAPRRHTPDLSPLDHVNLTLWSADEALRCHGKPSLWGEKVITAIRRFLASGRLYARTVTRLSNALERAISAAEGERPWDFNPERLVLSAHYFALHTAHRAHARQAVGDAAGWAVRDTARLAALAQGVPGGVRFCVGLARRLGM
jgi:hypothetical protein